MARLESLGVSGRKSTSLEADLPSPIPTNKWKGFQMPFSLIAWEEGMINRFNFDPLSGVLLLSTTLYPPASLEEDMFTGLHFVTLFDLQTFRNCMCHDS
jgi:hypothetical protein